MDLSLLLDMAAEGFEDRVVIGSRSEGISARELVDMAVARAELLTSRGATALVYLAENGPEFPTALFAAALAGIPLVPLNYRLGVEQLESLLRNHPGALAIAESRWHRDLQSAGIQALSPRTWMQEVSSSQSDYERSAPKDPAVIIYTSGTTSEPKGVFLRHSHLTTYVLNSVEFGAADASEASLVSVPPYHIAAVANVLSNVYAGRRVVVLSHFDADEWLRLVEAECITHALVVPTMLSRIVDIDPPTSLPTLQSLAYGGAPMPPWVIKKAVASWPDVDFVNAYGLTETSSTIAVLGPDDHRAALSSDSPNVRDRLSSVGRPLPSVDIEVRDESGRELPANRTGRIYVRGAQVSAEYAGSGSMLDADGFFDTRDRGYLDEDGYLYVTGRGDDTIIRGGENIAPAEIEAVLTRHEDVADAAVVGIRDPEWGERLEAVVVLRAGAGVEADDLRQHALRYLRSSKTPDRIEIWPELPHTATGKLLRREVAAELSARAGSETQRP